MSHHYFAKSHIMKLIVLFVATFASILFCHAQHNITQLDTLLCELGRKVQDMIWYSTPRYQNVTYCHSQAKIMINFRHQGR